MEKQTRILLKRVSEKKLLLTHLNPSFSWNAAPITLSPRLAIWEATTHMMASGPFICSEINTHQLQTLGIVTLIYLNQQSALQILNQHLYIESNDHIFLVLHQLYQFDYLIYIEVTKISLIKFKYLWIYMDSSTRFRQYGKTDH